MAHEIERKFLVKSNQFKEGAKSTYIHQGYLTNDANRLVRIRIRGKKAVLTIKALVTELTRLEYEYEIPVEDAEEMLELLCFKPTIAKTRYLFEYKGFTWEIDEFHKENEGLVVAEIELESEQQAFPKPDWVGEEVTHDFRYLNANLVKYPYTNWQD